LRRRDLRPREVVSSKQIHTVPQEQPARLLSVFLTRFRMTHIEGMSRWRCAAWSDVVAFTEFAGRKYLNLETFKKSGQGVETPVWFAAEPSLS
jgi:hypothetical protein